MRGSASEVLHWVYLAERSIQDSSDLNQAVRYMVKAESATKYVFDWTCVAKGWSQVLDDDRQQESRAMSKAMSVCDEFLVWVEIAIRWAHEFDDLDYAHRCMTEAESIASLAETFYATFCWTELARRWMQDFNDPKQMLRCMELAESCVKYPFTGDAETWGEIADAWEELGFDVRRQDARTKAEELNQN